MTELEVLMSINMYLQIITYIMVIGTVALVIYFVYRLILSMFNV